MISNVEQLVGYFEPFDSFDIDLSKIIPDNSDVVNTEPILFGSDIILLDNLHIACVSRNNILCLYNISLNRDFECFIQEKWKLPTIKPLFTLRLPFNLNCKCHLSYNSDLSILNIFVFFKNGLFYIVYLNVKRNLNDYILSLINTFHFSTNIINIRCITQISRKLFLLGSDSAIFQLFIKLEDLEKNNLPLFSTKEIYEDINCMVSDMHIIEMATEKNDYLNKTLFVAAFLQRSSELVIFRIKIDNCGQQETCEIAEKFIIKNQANIYHSKLCFIKKYKILLLLLNDTIYFYNVHLELGTNKNAFKLDLLKVKEFPIALDIEEDKRLFFSPQILCIDSEIYFSRVIWCNESIIENSFRYLPICEIYKIETILSSTNLENCEDLSINTKLIWSYGFQNFWYEIVIEQKLLYLLNLKDKIFNIEELLRFFTEKLDKICPSNTIFNFSLTEYKNLLKNFIELNINSEFGDIYLNNLQNIFEFKTLTYFIASLCSYLTLNDFTNYELCEQILDQKVLLKISEFMKLFFLLVIYFKRISNYCIHLFSNGNNVMLLSPISFSVIQDFSDISNLNNFFSRNGDSPKIKISDKFFGVFLHANYLIIKFILLKKRRKYNKECLNELLSQYNGKLNCEFLIGIISTLFSLFESKLIKKSGKKLIRLNSQKSNFFDLQNIDSNVRTFNGKDEFSFENLDMKILICFNSKELKQLVLQNSAFLSSLLINYRFSNLLGVFVANKQNIDTQTISNELGTSAEIFKLEMNTKFNLMKNIKINKIRTMLSFYSISIKNLYNFLILTFFYKVIGSRVSQNHNIDKINLISSINFEGSIFNFGRYFLTNKKFILSGAGTQKVSCFGLDNNVLKIKDIKTLYQLYKICIRTNSISDLFLSSIFSNHFLIKRYVDDYLFSNYLFWNSFIYSICKSFINNKGLLSTENLNLINILIKYFENQINNDNIENIEMNTYYFYVGLLFYKKEFGENEILIIEKLFENIKFIDNLIIIAKRELEINDFELQKFFCSENQNLKTIVLQVLILNLAEKIIENIQNFQLYNYFLNKVINYILIEMQANSSEECKFLLKSYLRNYLIQYIYLYGNYGMESNSFFKTIKDCIKILATNFDKMLLLTIFWISLNYFSHKKTSFKPSFLQSISCIFEEEDLFYFYSLLISIFWNHKLFDEFKFPSDSSFSVSMISDSFSRLRYEIYKFLIYSWEREKKYQDIAILAYLFSLKKYCELVLKNDINNSLFPQEWINFCLHDFNIIPNEFFTKEDTIAIFNEIFKALKYFNPPKIYNFQKKSFLSNSINSIIYSLNNYIKFITYFCQGSNEMLSYADEPMCTSRHFYCIKFPVIFKEKLKEESNFLVTYLPSVPYILYLKWYFNGILKMLVPATLDNFNIASKYIEIYGVYLEKFEEILSKNEIYLGFDIITTNNPKKKKNPSLKLSIIELIYNLTINGYCNTAFRLIEIIVKFHFKLERESLNSYNSYKNNCLTLHDTFSVDFFSKICKTLGFWTFSCCFFLMFNNKYLANMVEFNFENEFHLQRFKKRKRYQWSGYSFASTCLEELMLQNSNLRSLDIHSGKFNSKFGDFINMWNLVLDRLYSSPLYLQGVYLSILVNERIYRIHLKNHGIESKSFNRIIPSEIFYLKENPDILIFQNQKFSYLNYLGLSSLFSIIENMVYFKYFEKVVDIMNKIISNEDLNFKLPIILLLKLKFMLKSSDLSEKNSIFARVEYLIREHILSGRLH